MSTGMIDPRGPRVGASITSVLLAVVVLLGQSTAGLVLLTFMMLSFLLGTLRGAEGTWQGWVFKTFVRPRLGPPAEMEDRRPPRFAQGIGLLVTAVGVVLGAFGILSAVPIAAGVAFVAAALNAVFGLCLGCELYLLLRRSGLVRA
ncbi:DUF4395 domain-containing protein [Promicromonospora citrea]|uniref:Membrane protein n=1 Tax=Promicromonospora citrea TaxID=43677 RepID=A0A8H9L3A9_9MICO|nr:DUF4395 domain-containing protein [Promicromonospora citrea]NNH51966.1 DUF4395 domain-containing protein [Promicromonospora citrea]GGM19704.1 membrane protein [Promicromonospora citrea]